MHNVDEKMAERAFYETVGCRLKAARALHGITLTELAQKLGMSRTTLTNYEAGRIQISLYNYCRLLSELPLAECVLNAPVPGEDDDI